VSLGFWSWEIARFLDRQDSSDAFGDALIVAAIALYIAQFDPVFQNFQGKTNRHRLRVVGSSIICGTALFFHPDIAILSVSTSLIAIFFGLGL
jgi:hypothetical protein